eukprot:1194958-Prorocentrum_minimum.AAC.2
MRDLYILSRKRDVNAHFPAWALSPAAETEFLRGRASKRVGTSRALSVRRERAALDDARIDNPSSGLLPYRIACHTSTYRSSCRIGSLSNPCRNGDDNTVSLGRSTGGAAVPGGAGGPAGAAGREGKLAEAEPLVRAALDGLKAQMGEHHPSTLAAVETLADLRRRQGKLDEAEPLCRAAVQGRRAQLGDSHPRTLASIRGFANLLKEQGKAHDGGKEHSSTVRIVQEEGELIALRRATPRLSEVLQAEKGSKLRSKSRVVAALRGSMEVGSGVRGSAVGSLNNYALVLRCALDTTTPSR